MPADAFALLRRRSWRSISGALSLPVLLLAGVIALAAVLAYQAQDAARSHRATAESALRDYAAFGTAEFAREVRVHTQTLLRLSFMRVVFQLNQRPGDGPPTATAVAYDVGWQRAERVEPYWCDCLDSIRYYFAIDAKTGLMSVAPSSAGRVARRDTSPAFAPAGSGPSAEAARPPPTDSVLPSAAVQQWVRDTLLAFVAASGPVGPMTVATFGSADGKSSRFDLAITNDSYGFLIGRVARQARLLAFIVARNIDGEPLAIYGYEAEPGTWLRPLLELAVKEEQLLPPSLLGERSNEQVLAVRVRDAFGRTLYRSTPRFPEQYAAADTLTDRFGGLSVELSLFPAVAEQLLVGGLPHSRLPLLLALFLLTAGLAVVALIQTRHQQELARMRGDFVAGVSHELRTPLAQIRWFAELLRMGRLRSPEERERSLRVIDQESRRLAFLVENVLNFSRGGGKAARVRPEPVSLDVEVRDIVESFVPLLQSRRITVHTALEPGVAAMADRAALRQVVLNLLDNAAKYGPVGQTVVVGVGAAPGGKARLWVEDEGPGIPPSERERVWQPFYRAERDRGSATTGSGIGLSVVGALVTQQQGRRWIETAAGGGARMVVELPGVPAGSAALPRAFPSRAGDDPAEQPFTPDQQRHDDVLRGAAT